MKCLLYIVVKGLDVSPWFIGISWEIDKTQMGLCGQWPVNRLIECLQEANATNIKWLLSIVVKGLDVSPWFIGVSWKIDRTQMGLCGQWPVNFW